MILKLNHIHEQKYLFHQLKCTTKVDQIDHFFKIITNWKCFLLFCLLDLGSQQDGQRPEGKALVCLTRTSGCDATCRAFSSNIILKKTGKMLWQFKSRSFCDYCSLLNHHAISRKGFNEKETAGAGKAPPRAYRIFTQSTIIERERHTRAYRIFK